MQEFLTRIVVVLLVLFLGVDPTLAIGMDVNKQTNKQTNFDKSLLQAEALAARPRFSGERIIETDIPNGLQPLFNGTRPPLYGKPVGSLRKIHVRWPLRWEQVPMLQPEEGLEFGHLFHSRPRLESPIYRTEKSNEEQGSGTTSRTPKGTPALEELESKIFAVHSTPILPTSTRITCG